MNTSPEEPDNINNSNIELDFNTHHKKSSDEHSDTSSEGYCYNNIMKHMINLYENNLITPEDLSIILERFEDKKNEKTWNKEYTDIISCICEKAQCYRYMHEKSSDFYKGLSQKITFSNMFFSFLMSSYTIIFSEAKFIDSNRIALISGIGHLIIASLTGIQNKMKLPEKSESHYKSCSDFDSFCRELEYQLRLPIEDRQVVPKYVCSTIDKYENIVYSSPKIPSKILQGFRYWASSTNLDIDQPSIVKTFTNIHDLNKNEIYYDQSNIDSNVKFMKEFVDCKHIYENTSTPTKYKHKKTNRTPKIKKKSNFKIKNMPDLKFNGHPYKTEQNNQDDLEINSQQYKKEKKNDSDDDIQIFPKSISVP